MHLVALLLAALLAFLNTFDAVLTRVGIQSGAAAEGNPVMAWVIRLLGINGALALKVLFVSGIGFALALWTSLNLPVLVPIVLAALCGLYVWIVVNNLRVLRQ